MPTSAAGTTIEISAEQPIAQTEAAYAALLYVEISGVEKIGAYGARVAQTTFKPLNGIAQKHKGPTDTGALSLTVAHDDSDQGQLLLRVAGDDDRGSYCFRITYPDGGIRYFQGRVFGYEEAVETADGVMLDATAVEIGTAVIRSTRAFALPAPGATMNLSHAANLSMLGDML